jgi:hypothetical protein
MYFDVCANWQWDGNLQRQKVTWDGLEKVWSFMRVGKLGDSFRMLILG